MTLIANKTHYKKKLKFRRYSNELVRYKKIIQEETNKMEYYLIEIIHYFISTLSNADGKLNGVELIEK